MARDHIRNGNQYGNGSSGHCAACPQMHVDGYVKGSISVGGHRVTVGQTAHINAETVAGEVVRTYGQLALVQVHVGLKAYR